MAKQMPSPSDLPQEWRFPWGALALERRQQYADQAVIGGLAALVHRWAERVRPLVEDETLRATLLRLQKKAGLYARLSPSARALFVEELEHWARLVEEALGRAASGGAPACASARQRKERDRRLAEPRPPRASCGPGPLGWNSPLRALPGIGPARAEALAQIGLRTIGDWLQYYPFRYEDRRARLPIRSLQHRQTACLCVTVSADGFVSYIGKRQAAIVPATDGEAEIQLIWFQQPYRATQFPVGTRLIVSGSVRVYQDRVSLFVHEVEIVKDAEALHRRSLTPIYSAPPFSQIVMRKLMHTALQACRSFPETRVPASLVQQRRLTSLAEAFREIHFPTDETRLQAARRRLAYDELFLLQIRLAQRRREVKAAGDAQAIVPAADVLETLQSVLPFPLTNAQKRVIAEMAEDLERPEAASRLIHGDVGSGKTVVAAAALWAAIRAGRQAALMAPTEILAEQHCRTLCELLGPLGVQPLLLTGSLSPARKRQIQSRLAAGEPALVVGTHALFQEAVRFADLAVVVIDEQHRFGVRQRALLTGKGPRPNLFIMSATPIPRTLALTAYGDFDVSLLDELPPGRRPVYTELLSWRERRRAFEMIAALAAQGRQAFVICPFVEANEKRRLTDAESFYQSLQRLWPQLRLGLVHGQLDPTERGQVMERFQAGEIDVLVATTVVEVGVDIPNAAGMIILHAERFGLAQLHQLRGRIARSPYAPYCFLITKARDPDVIERLQVLVRTHDGFRVAEEDLRRRGPGELAGRRQSGLPDLRMADLLGDTQLLAWAREDAFALIEADPELAQAEHQGLRHWLEEMTASPEPWTL